MNKERITFIGAGNVSWHLAQAFWQSGYEIAQVWSRNLTNAQQIAKLVDAQPIDDLSQLSPTADIYIMAVSDNAIENLSKGLHLADKLLLHTAGSVPIRLLSASSMRYGVLWPVQTLVRNVPTAYTSLPFVIEGCTEATRNDIAQLAAHVSPHLFFLNEEQRQWAHLCATMVSNFGNAINASTQSMMTAHGCEFALLRPLIETTAHKAMSDNLWQLQTGPARRDDRNTLQHHRQLLHNNPDLLQLYDLMTRLIQKNTTLNNASC